MSCSSSDFEKFLQEWNTDKLSLKPCAKKLYSLLCQTQGASLEYKARPGVSYSLRGLLNNTSRPLFALLDIIDDEPEARWLSVCFYADSLNDPDEIGNFVPKGLLGEDAICFDLDENNETLLDYICTRLKEASQYKA